MNKKLIIGIIVIAILIAGGYFVFSKTSVISPVAKIICGSKPFGCEVRAFVKMSCGIKDHETLYLVEPDCTDVPSAYFDSNGKAVASCGGMPLPEGGSYKSSVLCDEIPQRCSKSSVPTFCL